MAGSCVRRVPALLAGWLVLLAGSCTVPFCVQERAGIEPGLSGSIGMGGSALEVIEGRSSIVPSFQSHPAAAATGVVSVRYGISKRFAMYVETNGLYGQWLGRGDINVYPRPWFVNVTAGGKFKIGQQGALRIGLSVPSLLECHYLYDASEVVSMNLGIGLRSGLSLGAGWHPRIGRHFVAHVAGSVGLPLTAQIGLGIEVIPGRDCREE